MKLNLSFLALTAMCSLTLLLPMEAATITTFTRQTIPSTVNGVPVTTQNFDSLPGGQTISTVDDLTFSVSLGSPIVSGIYFPTSGFYHLGSTSNDGGGFFNDLITAEETTTISFAQAISAFAIDIVSIADWNGAFRAQPNTGDTVLSVYAPFNSLPFGNQPSRLLPSQFIGFVSDTPFTSVTISALAVDGFFAQRHVLDTLRYAKASSDSIPEPSTLYLLVPAIVALGYCHRRQCQRNP